MLTKVLEEQANPQSVVSSKLRHTIRTLHETHLAKHLPPKNWWELRIFDERGKQIPLCEVSPPARRRMYELIQRDFPSGTLEETGRNTGSRAAGRSPGPVSHPSTPLN